VAGELGEAAFDKSKGDRLPRRMRILIDVDGQLVLVQDDAHGV
jgi:hypothetical protein